MKENWYKRFYSCLEIYLILCSIFWKWLILGIIGNIVAKCVSILLKWHESIRIPLQTWLRKLHQVACIVYLLTFFCLCFCACVLFLFYWMNMNYPRADCKRPCFDQLQELILDLLLFWWRSKMYCFSWSKHGRLQSAIGIIKIFSIQKIQQGILKVCWTIRKVLSFKAAFQPLIFCIFEPMNFYHQVQLPFKSLLGLVFRLPKEHLKMKNGSRALGFST